MVTSARILPFGDRAVLMEVDSPDEVIALHAGLEASRPDGVVDLVPAARTVLVRIDPRRLSLAAARAWASTVEALPPAATDAPEVAVPIVYDGPDLASTAGLLDIAPDELVRRHRDARWTVAFTGFAPGFGYLTSPDWPFDVPRLEAPRTRVPAGAVGLAAGFTGAYPRATPGGWRLIGTTSARLFDPDAASPALLAPGTRVRFAEADFRGVPSGDMAPAGTRGAGDEPPALRILEPGLFATVQDLGREGSAHLGVARSGALDRTALRAANRLVGNGEGAAAIEVTMGGLRAVAERDLWIAVTGAWGPVTIGGRAVDPYEAHAWRAGDELHIDWFAHGVRAYLAVRGGVVARAVLGSRATDRMAGLGPAPLSAGTALAIGEVGGDATGPIPVGALATWTPPHDDELELELGPGPRGDWFAASAHALLFDSVWTVTDAADRVGIRLDGPELPRARQGELPSEGMVPGALQVPPSGRPTILLADGPVTGGYPVIAAVTDASLDALGQARPGTRIRFRHARR